MIHRSEQTTPHRSKPIEATSNPSEQTTLREEGEREKFERERDEDIVERVGESEQMREKRNKIMFLFLQLCYSAILHVKLHYSAIANFFCNSVHIQFLTFGMQSPVRMLLWSLLASITQNSSF